MLSILLGYNIGTSNQSFFSGLNVIIDSGLLSSWLRCFRTLEFPVNKLAVLTQLMEVGTLSEQYAVHLGQRIEVRFVARICTQKQT